MKHQTSKSLLLLLSVVFSLSVNALGAQARIRVHVTNGYDDKSPAAPRILVTGNGTQMEVKHDEVINLNYGQYTVKVEMPGFEISTSSVLIDQPEQIISVAMKLGAVENEILPCSVVGDIAPATDIMRVRLIQLFGSYLTDVPLKLGGAFEFRNLACGEYMLVAMGPKGCVGTKTTTARVLPTRVEMKIGSVNGDSCTSPKP
jgi:hypothetical protein